ncbi:MAG: DNA polymerase I [Candidatus Paracaedibacteraceae bacterium]|nr:DNA polymerase I [Candidatus Paracaedibacteraceae bacterium]
MKKLFLIDGSGFIFRAYHALPPLTSPDGTPVGAVYGFCNMLRQLVLDHSHHHFLVVFDAGRQTFRQRIYAEYKAHRPPAPDDLVPQFPLFREVCAAFGVPCVEMADYEADDLIASYARQGAAVGFEVVIVSGDKDLMQLVNDQISLYDPLKRKAINIDTVIEKFGVPPSKVIDVQALAGDASDNVPGVAGIGVKTAAELISAYGDLETLLAQTYTIKQPKRRQTLIDNADKARISKRLVTLVDNLELPLDFDALFVTGVSAETLAFLSKMGFKTLLNRVQNEVNNLNNFSTKKEAIPLSSQLSAASQNYQMLTTVDEIAAFLDEASLAEIVAFDTETTSLHIRDAIWVGCSFAFRAENRNIKAAYIPFRHTTEEAQADFSSIKQLLANFLNQAGILKVGHNLKYDISIIAKDGLTLRSIEDTLLMSYCLHGGQHSHSMDYLAKTYLGRDTISFSSIAGTGKNQKTFDQIDLKTAAIYAAEDAEITLMLYEYFKPKLTEQHVSALYYDVERPLIPVIAAMEYQGIKVSPDVLKEFATEISSRLEILEKEIYQIAGREFNIASPKQLGEVLFDEQGLPAPKRTKTGAYITDADVLEDLVQKGHFLPTKILQWRSLSKLQSTYIEGLTTQINTTTKRIHTSYAMTGTSTGRLSSSEPNLQNIPIKTEDGRRIRKAFIADDGYVLVSLDYSQIELRLLAHFADIPALKQAFLDGVDIHKITASDLFGIPYEQITTEQRRQAKTVNFGIIYGISAYGLGQQLNIPNTAAAALIKSYLERYPGVEAFMSSMKEKARKNGYITTLMGRNCYTPGIHDRNGSIRQFAERQAVNAPLQGTNADIIKKAMAHVHHWLETDTIDARMLLQVHDELVFEVKETEAAVFIERVKSIMENVVQLSVPLIVEAGIGMNWDEAH